MFPIYGQWGFGPIHITLHSTPSLIHPLTQLFVISFVLIQVFKLKVFKLPHTYISVLLPSSTHSYYLCSAFYMFLLLILLFLLILRLGIEIF